VRVGAHLRSGLRTAVENAREVGADAAQLFISNPRAWSGPRLDTAERFGASWREGAIGPLYVHAPYLVNIASPNAEFLGKSIELCKASVHACGVLEASGFVVHAGAGGPAERHEALDRAATVLQATLLETPETTRLLVELMANTSGAVASTLAEAKELFDHVDDDRLGLVLDTCHLFATGYGLDTAEGVGELFAELHDTGLDRRLALVHLNDAKNERGSKRDRHEVVGEGLIGETGFTAFLRRPEVQALDAIVVETPASGETRRDELERIRRYAGLTS
jgi:deoxyribonuclease IV